jgi:mRNA interferase HigB
MSGFFYAHCHTKKIDEFIERHAEAKGPLTAWYKTLKSRNFISFADLRSVYPSVDRVGKLTVFNIGGNKFRLIAALHYNRKRIYIRAVLTHDEYNQGKWKE